MTYLFLDLFSCGLSWIIVMFLFCICSIIVQLFLVFSFRYGDLIWYAILGYFFVKRRFFSGFSVLCPFCLVPSGRLFSEDACLRVFCSGYGVTCVP